MEGRIETDDIEVGDVGRQDLHISQLGIHMTGQILLLLCLLGFGVRCDFQ